jgi:hypothetical protein
MLPPEIGKARLLTDVNRDEHRPRAKASSDWPAGTRVFALVKVCADREGAVEQVRIVKGINPTSDAEIVAKVKTWRYQPYVPNDRPVPFCFMTRLDFGSR